MGRDMDGYLIIEFGTKEAADACLSALNQVAAAHFASLGYTVKQTEQGLVVVGKNAATGEDNPEGVTSTWDDLKESPDNTFYFASPTPDPRFKDWRNYMPEGVDLGDEKPFPKEWIKESED